MGKPSREWIVSIKPLKISKACSVSRQQLTFNAYPEKSKVVPHRIERVKLPERLGEFEGGFPVGLRPGYQVQMASDPVDMNINWNN